MAIQTRQQSLSGGFGEVRQREPVRENIQAFTNLANTWTTQHQQALQQRSAIDVALSKVELDESENEWKADYIKNIKQQIDDAATYGNYSNALDTATILAGESISNPALLGRKKANELHKKAIELADAKADSGKISRDTAKAYKIANKYYYKDAYDDDGNVILGDDWKENRSLVDEVDLNTELVKLAQMVMPQQASVKSSTGNADGTSSSSGSSYERKTWEEMLKPQFMEQFNNNPALRDTLNQKLWAYNTLLDDTESKIGKLDEELKLDPNNSDLKSKKADLEAQKDTYTSQIINKDGIITDDPWEIMMAQYPITMQSLAYNHTSKESAVDKGTYASRNAGVGGLSKGEVADMIQDALPNGTQNGTPAVVKVKGQGYGNAGTPNTMQTDAEKVLKGSKTERK